MYMHTEIKLVFLCPLFTVPQTRIGVLATAIRVRAPFFFRDGLPRGGVFGNADFCLYFKVSQYKENKNVLDLLVGLISYGSFHASLIKFVRRCNCQLYISVLGA